MNKELLEKARQAKSPEELLALAKENNIEISEEHAKALFERLNGSEKLADEELDNVAGGCEESDHHCGHCGSTNVRPAKHGGYYCNVCHRTS